MKWMEEFGYFIIEINGQPFRTDDKEMLERIKDRCEKFLGEKK
jgi:hypothetical protein